MTDITDNRRGESRDAAHYILDNPFYNGHPARELAEFILATVEAPVPALAERLEYRADMLDNGDPDGDTPQALRDLATDAAQMEHDLTEARAEVERLTTDEIEALPHLTVIRDSAGVMFQRIVHGWYQAGDTSVHRSDDNFICLPVTVLWEGQE